MSEQRIDPATISRRTAILGVAGFLGAGLLAGRLYYLQVVKAEDYTVLSDRNRFNFNILIPERGQILDRNGVQLAVNKQNYRVLIIPEQVDSIDTTLDKVSEILPITDSIRKRVKRESRRRASFIPVLIDSHIDWKSFAALNIRTPDLPGVIPDVGQGRYYPYEGLFAHTLGYVGTADPDDLEKDPDRLLRQPDFRIGKTGVEASSDKILRGKSGRLKVEVNARGRVVREWPDPANKPEAGKNVWLTLDADLQRYAADLFLEDSGGVAVMDVMTGELRTLLSMPTFDGNLFVSGLTQADMQQMNGSEKRPQFNKVLGGGYPPASTFKMVVMLAALEAGIIDTKEKIYCTGKVRLGRRNFHCWKRRGHGPMDMRDSLKQSCDVYYYEIADRLGIDPIHDMARRLGFGDRFDIGIAGQTRGIVPNDAWKKGFEALDINPRHLQIVRDAMWSVCEEVGGTAYRQNGLGFPELDMAGKTGTGQVRSISRAERQSGVVSNKRLAWELRDHSVFVGYAPFNAPRFAVATLVEHGGSGAGRAADISRNLLRRALERDGVVAQAPMLTKEL